MNEIQKGRNFGAGLISMTLLSISFWLCIVIALFVLIK